MRKGDPYSRLPLLSVSEEQFNNMKKRIIKQSISSHGNSVCKPIQERNNPKRERKKENRVFYKGVYFRLFIALTN